MAAAKVLHERMPADDHARRAVAFQAAHRSRPCFHSCIVGLNPIVRVADRVMLGVAQEILDRTDQRLRLVGGDLLGASMRAQHPLEEPTGRRIVSSDSPAVAFGRCKCARIGFYIISTM